MKTQKFILLAFILLFSNSVFTSAVNTVFTYDKQELNARFSELINIENIVLSKDLSYLDLFTGVFNFTGSDNYFNLQDTSKFNLQDTSRCEQAKRDAFIMYKPTGPFFGSFCCTGGTNPLFGLILAFSTQKKTPKDGNLGLTDYTVINDEEYIKCYRAAALAKKKKAIWTGFGVGTALYVLVEVVYFTTILEY